MPTKATQRLKLSVARSDESEERKSDRSSVSATQAYIAIIVGTRVPVRAVVELWRLGVAPEEIPTHLSHLTLAQVFDALSYYTDHQAEIQQYSDRNQVPDDLGHPLARPDA